MTFRPTWPLKAGFFHAVFWQGCSSYVNSIASKSTDDTDLGGKRADRQNQAAE